MLKLNRNSNSSSSTISYSFGFLSFVKSIFLFEDAQIDKAIKDLDLTQKQCKENLKKISAAIKKTSCLKSNQNDTKKVN